MKLIPHKLFQTYKTKNLPKQLKLESSSWKKSNPHLKLTFMDDNECLKFIKSNFSQEIYDLYISLPLGIMKSDFWRIAVVYINGGVYSDTDVTMNININELIESDTEAVFILEQDNISNFFFAAIPKHPVLKAAFDHMVRLCKYELKKIDVQTFGMHPLHKAVREYYNVIKTNYVGKKTIFLNNLTLKNERKLIHNSASSRQIKDYDNWRLRQQIMQDERSVMNDILFFTTFNKNGYELYGKMWVKTFIAIANYYTNFKAKIYYEGFVPTQNHSNIEWVEFKSALPKHETWKNEYIKLSNHSSYVKTMTVRFSHKAFVIQHALDSYDNDYLIWVDGDCIFKNDDYTNFPKQLLNNKFLACQVEESSQLNHVESGILIFDNNNVNTKKWNNQFKNNYSIDKILNMGEPYDGFIVWKSILTGNLVNDIVDLNDIHGKGGIQSDPNQTFLHPEIKSKFYHNIGWTGKSNYENWEHIQYRDDIYKKMKLVLFGHRKETIEKRKKAFNKLEKLKKFIKK